MFEWKPPDPRIVALVRRIQDAAHRRRRDIPGNPERAVVIDENQALDCELDDLTLPGSDAPDQDLTIKRNR